MHLLAHLLAIGLVVAMLASHTMSLTVKPRRHTTPKDNQLRTDKLNVRKLLGSFGLKPEKINFIQDLGNDDVDALVKQLRNLRLCPAEARKSLRRQMVRVVRDMAEDLGLEPEYGDDTLNTRVLQLRQILDSNDKCRQTLARRDRKAGKRVGKRPGKRTSKRHGKRHGKHHGKRTTTRRATKTTTRRATKTTTRRAMKTTTHSPKKSTTTTVLTSTKRLPRLQQSEVVIVDDDDDDDSQGFDVTEIGVDGGNFAVDIADDSDVVEVEENGSDNDEYQAVVVDNGGDDNGDQVLVDDNGGDDGSVGGEDVHGDDGSEVVVDNADDSGVDADDSGDN